MARRVGSLLFLVLLVACGDQRAPAALVGFQATPPVWECAPGQDPAARLRGTLQWRNEGTVPAGSRLRMDQGYREDGHSFFGREVRYRLPQPVPDLAGLAGEAVLRVGGQVVALRVPGLDEGLLAAVLESEVPAGTTWNLDVGANEGGGLLPPTIPLDIQLTVFLEQGDSSPVVGAVPVRIVDPELHWLRIVGPAQGRPGEAVPLRVTGMSGFPGPGSSSMVSHLREADLEWWWEEQWRPVAATLVPQAQPFDVWQLDSPPLPAGVHRLPVRLKDRPQVRGVSSPIRVADAGAPGWFFGSLHNHTAMGGHASGTPRASFTYAREVAGLDFCALTEHAEAPLLDWDWLCQVAQDESRDPGFAAFAGCEWTHPDDGHRHLVYRDGGPAVAAQLDPPAAGVLSARTLEQLAELLSDVDGVVCIGHHPTWRAPAVRGFRWLPADVHPRETVVEAYSWHGCALGSTTAFPIHGGGGRADPQTSVMAVLAAGWDLAVNADSDQHLGRPGSLVGVQWREGMRFAYQGLTVLRARGNGREALFEALEQGRLYGTTGARILLEARPFGDTWQAEVHAAAPIRAVRLHAVSGTETVSEHQAVAPTAGDRFGPLFLDPALGTWSLQLEGLAGDATGPLILEVEQQDAHMAWLRLR